ncbi:MAG: SH3 domain-containing protein [Gammaproteobacteria bacterium]|nr:SH3 domain-containing protein [Gammaproteobacteria bacterium]
MPETAPPPSVPSPVVPSPEEKIVVITEQASCEAVNDRARWLSETVDLLQEDLNRAEATLIAMESGLKTGLTRADAVAGLAEGRLALETAAAVAPWREADIKIAREKLNEADEQITNGHNAAAIFFVYRAKRIAGDVIGEAGRIEKIKNVEYVVGDRVNLRSGPRTSEQVLAVLTRATPVYPVEQKDNWVLVRTTRGHAGWIYRKYVGAKRPES